MATVTYDKASRIYPGGDKPAVDALDLPRPLAIRAAARRQRRQQRNHAPPSGRSSRT